MSENKTKKDTHLLVLGHYQGELIRSIPYVQALRHLDTVSKTQIGIENCITGSLLETSSSKIELENQFKDLPSISIPFLDEFYLSKNYPEYYNQKGLERLHLNFVRNIERNRKYVPRIHFRR